jgi:TetR/AcrR family transcriptional regulator, regulator of biofilm formation and stress response
MTYIRADERRAQVVTAARAALVRDGVGRMTMRSVAAEAQIPLGNLHYAFPSKEALIKAVLEDIIDEIVRGLRVHSPRGRGLAESLGAGLRQIWASGTAGGPGLQLLQYELTTHALRTPGLAELATWQYAQYVAALAGWCEAAAEDAGEVCAVDFDTLARVLLAGLDGLILQHLVDPDDARSAADLEHVITAVIALADPRPAQRLADRGFTPG